MGKLGEQIAKRKLSNQGLRFVTQNFYTRFGEIDLIYEDGNVLVFVEVKTRSGYGYGHPTQAVSSTKLSRLRKAAEIFVTKNPKYYERLFRVDVVSIVVGRDPQFEHYKNVY